MSTNDTDAINDINDESNEFVEKEIHLLKKLLELDIKFFKFNIQYHKELAQLYTNITTLDNDFFENKYKNITNSLKNQLDFYKEEHGNDECCREEKFIAINNNINNIIDRSCKKHTWVYDTIDISPERSQNICYCSVCEVTKK